MSRGLCWPWSHKWTKTKVTAPIWDAWARGELWTCKVCGKVKAK